MKVFFLDTNVFIQCHKLEELPWGEVSDQKDVLLLISRPVQEEIDRQKHDRNSRRSKRARNATSFFRSILRSKDNKVIIRESKPRVEITFSPRHYQKQKKSEILDPTYSDDQIIQEALNYMASNSDKEVALLTHDTNPQLTAESCGLPYVIIPDDWLLPPEPDPRDKEIAKLKSLVKVLENQYSQIDVVAEDERQNKINLLSLSVTTYEPLVDNKLDEIVTEARARCPLVNHFEEPKKPNDASIYRMLGRRYQPPSKESIERYKEFEYPEWLNKVRKFLKELPNKLELPGRYAGINFIVKNSGTRPAENVLVDFSCKGGLLFAPPGSEYLGEKLDDLSIPAPPKPPEGKWIKRETTTSLINSMVGRMSRYNYASPLKDFHLPRIPGPPEVKDKNAFYWKNKAPSTFQDAWVYECEEFRHHQVEPETFRVVIFIPPNTTIKRGVVKCRITSKNLLEPAVYDVPVQIEYVEGDTVEEAHILIDKIKRQYISLDPTE